MGLVIRSLADKRTEQWWVNGTERRMPPDIARRAVRKLSAADAYEVEVGDDHEGVRGRNSG
jgi:hypothetical protein